MQGIFAHKKVSDSNWFKEQENLFSHITASRSISFRLQIGLLRCSILSSKIQTLHVSALCYPSDSWSSGQLQNSPSSQRFHTQKQPEDKKRVLICKAFSWRVRKLSRSSLADFPSCLIVQSHIHSKSVSDQEKRITSEVFHPTWLPLRQMGMGAARYWN